MKPAPFDYVAARSVEHAVELLAGDTEAKVIAGGQSLMPILNMRLGRPELVIDIGRLDVLNHVRISESGALLVGAAATQTQLLAHPGINRGWPLLATAVSNIGHPQIRNRGTICGSLAHNDPAAELPATAIALDATMHIQSSRGLRTIPAEQMFVGPFMTALAPDDLLIEAEFPLPPAGAGWSFREFATRPGDFATVGVAVQLIRRDGVVADTRIVLFGVGGSATRVHSTEEVLMGSSPSRVENQVRAQLEAELDPADDVHASAGLRQDLAEKLTIEAIAEAWERCA
jgi:carbon-monoxide dehydrogenase medium subunit